VDYLQVKPGVSEFRAISIAVETNTSPRNP